MSSGEAVSIEATAISSALTMKAVAKAIVGSVGARQFSLHCSRRNSAKGKEGDGDETKHLKRGE
jgi:hypothetical protein